MHLNRTKKIIFIDLVNAIFEKKNGAINRKHSVLKKNERLLRRICI